MTERLPDSDDGPAEIWLSPSCGPREWCNTPEWGETCPDCGKPSVRYVRADALAEARAAERERCAKVAERRRSGRQPEPHEIADEIRALSDETPSAGSFPEEERLLKLMRDPRYWKDRDPEITRAVTEGFRALYPSAGDR